MRKGALVTERPPTKRTTPLRTRPATPPRAFAAACALLLVLGACVPTSPKASTTRPIPKDFVAFQHSEAGYRTAYPTGWTPRAGTEPRFQNFVSPDQKSFLLVSLAPNHFSDPDLEQAGSEFQFNALGAAWPRRAPQQHRSTLNGVGAVETIAEYALGSDGLTLHYYAFNQTERTWVVAYLGPTGRYAEERPLFEQFARSFQVLDRAKLPAHLAQVGRPAPAFVLPGIDDKEVRLSDFRGRPVLVNFWAAWCSDCRVEMPLMNEAYADQGNRELVVIGTNYGEDRAHAAPYARELGIRFPLALDPNKATARAYGVIGPPTSFFIDRGGIVREIGIGLMPRDKLRTALNKIV